MNYFELYPGDYLRDTMRLSLTEHGAFVKLLFAYYAEEEALPADFDELFTIAGAVKTADKMAVKKVAEKYFPLGPDGLRHNGRADAEISKAGSRMEGKERSKSAESERQQRFRDRRKAMFEALAKVGIVPDFNISMGDLTDLVTQNVTLPTVTNVTQSRPLHTATRPQTPDPITEQELSRRHASQDGEARDDDEPVPGEQDLPSWVPRPLWREFYRHRAVCRKPLSIPSQRQVVERLTDLREKGHNITASLKQTIAAGLAIPVVPKYPGEPSNNTGPPRHATNGAPPMSKTLQALHELEAVKNGTGLDRSRDQLRIAEADPAQP